MVCLYICIHLFDTCHVANVRANLVVGEERETFANHPHVVAHRQPQLHRSAAYIFNNSTGI